MYLQHQFLTQKYLLYQLYHHHFCPYLNPTIHNLQIDFTFDIFIDTNLLFTYNSNHSTNSSQTHLTTLLTQLLSTNPNFIYIFLLNSFTITTSNSSTKITVVVQRQAEGVGMCVQGKPRAHGNYKAGCARK